MADEGRGDRARPGGQAHVSTIAAALRPSPIRQMAPFLSRPEVISLAGGVPCPSTFPVREVAQALEAVLVRDPSQALQYGRTRGAPLLLEQIQKTLSAIGIEARDEQTFVTAGSQQGLDLVGRLLLERGDTVIVETPTYAGALAAFRAVGATFRALGTGGSEPDPRDVDRAVARAHASGSTARVLYLCPSFQNPAGTTLTAASRAALAVAAERNGLVLVEDDPYRELWFDAPPPEPIATLAPGAPVIYLGSLSKVLAPGMRLGFAVLPDALAAPFERLKEATDLCTSTLSQAVAAELLATGVLARRLPDIRSFYRSRRDALLAALEASLPAGVTFTRPGGGFFTWLEVPGVDAEKLLVRALEKNVAFVPGAGFHGEGGGESTLRLAFSKEPEPRLRQAAELLGGLLASAP